MRPRLFGDGEKAGGELFSKIAVRLLQSFRTVFCRVRSSTSAEPCSQKSSRNATALMAAALEKQEGCRVSNSFDELCNGCYADPAAANPMKQLQSSAPPLSRPLCWLVEFERMNGCWTSTERVEQIPHPLTAFLRTSSANSVLTLTGCWHVALEQCKSSSCA